MSKDSSTWESPRLGRTIKVVRWGEVGTPVLVFPTAGGDAEEIERYYLVDAVARLLEARSIKVYSVDSIAGRSWLSEDNSTAAAARIQNRFDACIHQEVVPAIRKDCRDEAIEIIAAGASIGAYNALAAVCRHPDVFRAAVCMSGTYDLRKFLDGPINHEYRQCSPLDFVPDLPSGDHLGRLRERFVILAHGEGRFEEPAQSWRAAHALGGRGVPNRVDSWGPDWHHDWETWREMLPKYLDELLAAM
jgi:esterase/lipase superfamily enzyme